MYSIRQGVESVFGSTSLPSSSSSTSSKGTSSSSSANRQKPRPCLTWRINQETVEVLMMASFNDTDPKDSNEIFPHIPRDILMKKLLLIWSKNLSENGIFPAKNLNGLKHNTYLILVPVMVPLKQKWTTTEVGPFNQEQLRHINNQLRQLALEEIDNQEKQINEFNCNIGDDEKDDSSSSSSLPLPKTRSISFLNNISSDKTNLVNQWLNDGE